DPAALTATSSVTVTVSQTPTAIAVTPAGATVPSGGTQAFAATASDQFGQAVAPQPTLAWSIDAGGVGGAISPAGPETGPAPGAGAATVRATGGGVSGTATVTVTSAQAPVLAIDAGGPSAGGYQADADVTGGSVYSTGDAIDTSGVSGAAPQSVYQTERFGDFTYTLPNLTPNGSYTVRLHYAES